MIEEDHSEHDRHSLHTNSSQLHGEDTFVVECVIGSMNLLIPFTLSASVEEIADKAHTEFKVLNPRSPPMKILCVRDEHGRILSKKLRIDEHNLTNSSFHIQMAEFSAADMIAVPAELNAEYRRWQLYTARQIYESIKAALMEQFSSASLEMLRNSQEMKDGGLPEGTAARIDPTLLDLLNEISFSPNVDVKLMCLETLSLIRMQDRDVDTVLAATIRIARYIQEERESVEVVAYGLHAFRSNAKGLLPLSPLHQQEVAILHRLFRIDAFNAVLSRFPDREHQRQLMMAYKSMYIHHYDVSVDRMRSGDGFAVQETHDVALRSSKPAMNLSGSVPNFVDAPKPSGFYADNQVQNVSQQRYNAVRILPHGNMPSESSFQEPILTDAAMPLHKENVPDSSNIANLDAGNVGDSKDSNSFIVNDSILIPVVEKTPGFRALSSDEMNPWLKQAKASVPPVVPSGDAHQRAMAAVGMTISRICNLLVSEEQSVWKFAVNKLHVLLTATRASSEQAVYGELVQRRRKQREITALGSKKNKDIIRNGKYQKLREAAEKEIAAKQVGKTGGKEKEDQAKKAMLKKLGDKARQRLQEEEDEKERIKQLEIARKKQTGESPEDSPEDVDPAQAQRSAKLQELELAYRDEEQVDEKSYQTDLLDDNESTFGMNCEISMYTDYRPLFLSNGEVDLLVSCLFDSLRASIDTRAKGVLSGSVARGAFDSSKASGEGSRQSDRPADGFIVSEVPKAKQLIEAALVSPLTDLPSVLRIVDCLYMLALPMKLDPSADVNHPIRTVFTSTLQASVAKVCLSKARILLTLCHAENNVLAGKCAFLLHLAVRYNAKVRREQGSNGDSNKDNISTSMDDGWTGLNLKIDPEAMVGFIMAHNKSIQTEVKDTNFNRNSADSSYTYNQISTDKASAKNQAGKDEEEEETDTFSKHLVNLGLDFIYSMSQVHSGGGVHTAVTANYNADRDKTKGSDVRGRRGKAISRKESGELEDVLSEANMVKGYFRDADTHFNSEIDDNADDNRSKASSMFSEYAQPAKQRRNRDRGARGFGGRALKESERLLERLFLGSHYVYLLRLWHIANNSTDLEELIPFYRSRGERSFRSSSVMVTQEISEFQEAQRLLLDYSVSMQQRRIAMEILSHLCALSTAFRDQLIKINAIPKLIVLAGSPGIVVSSGGDYQPYLNHSKYGNITRCGTPPELTDESLLDAKYAETDQEILSGALNELQVRDRASVKLDISTVRSLLRLLLNLVVTQTPKKQATICRLLQEVPLGGKAYDMDLREISQTDESCAFYLATLQSFQLMNDE